MKEAFKHRKKQRITGIKEMMRRTKTQNLNHCPLMLVKMKNFQERMMDQQLTVAAFKIFHTKIQMMKNDLDLLEHKV